MRTPKDDIIIVDNILRLVDFGILTKLEGFDLILHSIWSLSSSIGEIRKKTPTEAAV